nr:MAG TPA: hypothetical protein [Caudoviricetes sp.]
MSMAIELSNQITLTSLKPSFKHPLPYFFRCSFTW